MVTGLLRRQDEVCDTRRLEHCVDCVSYLTVITNPSVHLGSDIVVTSDHGHLLGVTFSSDLCLNWLSVQPASSFYWLRQLQRCWRSLDMESTTTLVRAFMSSHIDYCNALLTFAPKMTTEKLQRMFRISTKTGAFSCGCSVVAHWLVMASPLGTTLARRS